MSFGMFDDLAASQSEGQIREAAASDGLNRAIIAVRDEFGPFLAQAQDRGDYDARCGLVKNDIMKVISSHIMPLPKVVRRVEAALRPDFTRVADVPGGYDETQGDALSDRDLANGGPVKAVAPAAPPVAKPPRQQSARRRTAASMGHPSRRYVLFPHGDIPGALSALRKHANDMAGHRSASVHEAVDLENTDGWLPDAHKALQGGEGSGFTLHDEHGDAPTKGYMVSTDKRSEWQKPVDEVTHDDILGFAKQHGRRLENPRNFLGGWVDSEEHGKPTAYLDISSHISDPRKAHQTAIAARQWGIFDNAKGEAISTKEFGKSLGDQGPKQPKRRALVEGQPLIPEPVNKYLDLPNDDAVENAFDGPSKKDTGIERHTDRYEAAVRPFAKRS